MKVRSEDMTLYAVTDAAWTGEKNINTAGKGSPGGRNYISSASGKTSVRGRISERSGRNQTPDRSVSDFRL